MIMRSKIFNSKAYQVFDYICRLVILNILLIIMSFSIILLMINIFPNMKNIYRILCLIPTALNFLPSVVAIAEVIKGYEVEKNTGIFKEFFNGFKKYPENCFLISTVGTGITCFPNCFLKYFSLKNQNTCI